MASHRILVLGATGESGRRIIAEAKERGHQVTAFARNPAKMAADLPGTPHVIGDVRDAKAVADAVAGHDVVISALGVRRGEPVCAAGVRNAIAGLGSAGGRLIVLSAYGTGDSRHGVYGWLLHAVAGRVTKDKVAMEQATAESGFDWTIVRPPILTKGARTGRVAVFPGDANLGGFKRMSRADLAKFMIDAIDDPSTFRRTVVVTQG